MADSVVLVVGDQYGAFTRHRQVITLSDFRQRREVDLDGARVLIGQGISHGEVEALGAADADATPTPKIEPRDALASLAHTHKRDPANVLVTNPRRQSPGRYTAQLALNDSEDRLLDHVTGAHVSGIVLVEAGRQAVIACGEIDHALGSRAERWGFVWTGLQVSFTRFAFPLPTELRIELHELAASTASKPSYSAKVSVWQAGKSICEMQMDYGLLPEKTLAAIEARAGSSAVEALCSARATHEPTAPKSVAEAQPSV
jgi:hypothetical protein